MAPYRPSQGVHARVGTAGILLIVALFGSYRVYRFMLVQVTGTFELLGLQIPYAALWAGGLFLVLGLLVGLLTLGPQTGLEAVDSKSRAVIDLLIDTEAELKKVSWPGREELIRSTTAVLVSIVLLGLYLLGVDWAVGNLMRVLDVLPL
jgi:preprotein translocase subunit SecE